MLIIEARTKGKTRLNACCFDFGDLLVVLLILKENQHRYVCVVLDKVTNLCRDFRVYLRLVIRDVVVHFLTGSKLWSCLKLHPFVTWDAKSFFDDLRLKG